VDVVLAQDLAVIIDLGSLGAHVIESHQGFAPPSLLLVRLHRVGHELHFKIVRCMFCLDIQRFGR